MSAIKKILAPTDFSEDSKESLSYACTLADALSAIIHGTERPYVPGRFLDHYAPDSSPRFGTAAWTVRCSREGDQGAAVRPNFSMR